MKVKGFICAQMVFLLITASFSLPETASIDDIMKKAAEFKTEIGVYGNSLVLSTITGPKTFNLAIATETSSSDVLGFLFEGLTKNNGVTNIPEPNLAESWTHSEDGLNWTFKLRKDVKWFDGKPFTASDVIFTFNDIIYNESIPTSSRYAFLFEIKNASGEKHIEKIKLNKLDDYTVEFRLPAKSAPFLEAIGTPIYPAHILRPKVQDGSFATAWNVSAPPAEIIGTGPFMLSSYKQGERIILKRNPNYWKKDAKGNKLPYLEQIIFLIVPSIDTAELKFEVGEIDFYSLRGTDYPILKPKEKNGNFTIWRMGPATGTNFLVFNQNPNLDDKTKKPFVEPYKLKWFTNMNFRRAVSYALDKQSMIELVLNSFGYPQWSPISPGEGFFHKPDVKTYEYNLEKARELLAQIGCIDRNKDGVLEDSDKNKVEFNLETNTGNDIRIKICDMIKEDLGKIGIKVNFRQVEFNQLVSKLNAIFDWEAVLLGLTGGTEPHFGSNVWRSDGNLHLWNPNQKEPATKWEVRIDELFSLGLQELDRDKRKVYYDEFQDIVADKLPVIYTVLGERMFAVRNKFGNFNPTIYGTWHNIEEIFIKKP